MTTGFPLTLWKIGLVHTICVILCCISLAAITNQKSVSDLCMQAPVAIQTICKCELTDDGLSLRLNCKNINETRNFWLEEETRPVPNSNSISMSSDSTDAETSLKEFSDAVSEIFIRDSRIGCVNIFRDFGKFSNLRKLSLQRSHVKTLECSEFNTTGASGANMTVSDSNPASQTIRNRVVTKELDSFLNLKALDVAQNELSEIQASFFSRVPNLQELNLTQNAIYSLKPKLMDALTDLEVLDISGNKLNENLDPVAFRTLPSTLKYLNIAANDWSCSPKLSWMFNWSEPLITNSVLANANGTRCRYEDSTQEVGLLLVMEYYVKKVIPSCPYKNGCICLIQNIQEKVVVSRERSYTVFVSCPNQGLAYFPKLPKHTRIVDLSDNKLNESAFNLLKVADHNYDEVDNLTLNNNLLESLPESLLDMRLGLSFSAKGNKLTTISYDFSQRLIKMTTVIELSGNPWICSCSSQINDLNLLAKVRDKSNMTCGPESDDTLINQQVGKIDLEVLCPPDTNGESQEILLQLLCGLLSILIVLVLTKLSYDAWVYRTRGELPWLVLKMP